MSILRNFSDIYTDIIILLGITAQYQWNCSVPDDNGERYIPGIEIGFERNILTVPTAVDEVTMNRVQNRISQTECTGEVTAIEFCYRYSAAGQGEPVFNWTVLILEENSNSFTITRIITIESHPSLLNEGHCTNVGEGQVECCDREDFNSFSAVTNNNIMFVFGVTESAQGNTHNATLLGVHESQHEYRVFALSISTIGQTIAVGSTLPKPRGGNNRGLKLLRFVIGKLLYCKK